MEVNNTVYKDNIGEYPLLDYPCEHWWVRYATACTVLYDSYQKLWEPKLKELEQKHNYSGFCYSGCFDFAECAEKPNKLKWYDGRTIKVFQNKKNVELSHDSEVFKVLEEYIKGLPEWGDCPYQMEHQSVCPLYKKSEFYASRSLEELRSQKEYDL